VALGELEICHALQAVSLGVILGAFVDGGSADVADE
jgi:hypothetical protein